jgi:membrane protein
MGGIGVSMNNAGGRWPPCFTKQDREQMMTNETWAEQAGLRQPHADATGTPAPHQPESPHRPESAPAGESYVKSLYRIALAAGNAWLDRRASSKGAALALYTLFSLAPMLVLIVAMVGLVYGADTVREALLQQLGGLIGDEGSGAIKAILAGTQQHTDGIVAGIISGVIVLISATSAFAELKDSLDELWEVPKPEGSGVWLFLRERVLSFGLLLVLMLMLLASLAISTALGALGELWQGSGSGYEVFAQYLSNAVSFLILTALFAVIYKFLPATRIAWKDVVVGALLTAVLFMVGKAAIGLYLGHGNFSSAYGAAGSIVALITWIYYSAQIFFYGSLFTHEYAFRIGSRNEGAAAVRNNQKAPT